MARIRATIFARAGNGAPLDKGIPQAFQLVNAYIEHRYNVTFVDIFQRLSLGHDIRASAHDDAVLQQAVYDVRRTFFRACQDLYHDIPTHIRIHLVTADLERSVLTVTHDDDHVIPASSLNDDPPLPNVQDTHRPTVGDLLAGQGHVGRITSTRKQR